MSLAWKAKVLPLNYSRTVCAARVDATPMLGNHFQLLSSTGVSQFAGGGDWIRTSVGVSQQIYSLPPLATRAPLQKRVLDYAILL